VSGPSTEDEALGGVSPAAAAPEVEVTESRVARVGAMTVRRALPRRARRTVGAWCFADHMGPAEVDEGGGVEIGPHPHIGLQTVTWLTAGEVLHRDSLGSEQPIRPGQLNLMTAGRGVAHAEERTGRYRGRLEGIQLWVAQPSATREGDPAFEHHGELPRVELDGARATVLVGPFAGARSPARRDTEHVGVDLELPSGPAELPLEPTFEYGLVLLEGAVELDGHRIEPGHLAYLGRGRDECRLTAVDGARGLLLGGLPFPEPVLMWWNFVARTQDEISEARRAWMGEDDRFGFVGSPLERIGVGPPPWAPPP
jgi:quercetin 2,3-dioxygenase